MMRLLRSFSRTVHEEQEVDHQDEEYWKLCPVADGAAAAWVALTVWRKSLCVGCKGFTVINSDGDLVYRVDNYPGGGRLNHILLMDALGHPILTISRTKQKLGLVDNWLMYQGEDGDHSTTTKPVHKNKPICCARKHVNNILQRPKTSILARVYRGNSNTSCRYVIEGSYGNRSCKVYDESRRLVAEIRKKEAMSKGVSFGVDVFVLNVRRGFSTEFAMGIVLLLDQMFS